MLGRRCKCSRGATRRCFTIVVDEDSEPDCTETSLTCASDELRIDPALVTGGFDVAPRVPTLTPPGRVRGRIATILSGAAFLSPGAGRPPCALTDVLSGGVLDLDGGTAPECVCWIVGGCEPTVVVGVAGPAETGAAVPSDPPLPPVEGLPGVGGVGVGPGSPDVGPGPPFTTVTP